MHVASCSIPCLPKIFFQPSLEIFGNFLDILCSIPCFSHRMVDTKFSETELLLLDELNHWKAKSWRILRICGDLQGLKGSPGGPP